MRKADVWAWHMIRFTSLMQGYVGSLLYPYAKTMRQKMKIIQITMSGYYIWNSTMEDVPREMLVKLLPMGKILLVMVLYDITRTVTRMVGTIIGAMG